MEETFDYIIVGAGPAGCAIANRLSERSDIRVLLIEAGGKPDSFWFVVPLGIGKLMVDRAIWRYKSEPEMSGREIEWAHGRVLGGSGSVNGMLFVRGEPRRYDEWRDAGCPGWGWNDVLPYFKRLEDYPSGDPEVRGRGGPISIMERDVGDPISAAFVAACNASGLSMVADYNGRMEEGVCRAQMNVRNGMRFGPVHGYLKPARGRANLVVRTHAPVDRVTVSGNRATGIAYRVDGVSRAAVARREVILAGGAYHSPHLLELSGIGNAEILRRHGIEVVKHLPGVGENLRDHIHPRVTFETNLPITVNDMLRNKVYGGTQFLKWLFLRKGLLTSNGFTVMGFTRSSPSMPYPDIRFQCPLFSGSLRNIAAGLDPFSGFHLGAYFFYPESRGYVHLKSSDPGAMPSLKANYLTDPRDLPKSIAGVKFVRRLSQDPAFRPVIVRETRPGPEVVTDDEIEAYIHETGQTSWHPVGSCRMGNDADAVVDPRLRVHGVAHLRVADASVMPFHTTSNTHAPAIMIGEKAADLILEDAAEA
jgi:choline dehydrogenase